MLRTSCSTTQRHHVRNSARLALSHTAHDGQHLLPAVGGDDVDRSGSRHSAQLLVVLVRGDPITYPRLLHKVCLVFGIDSRLTVTDAIPAGYTSGVEGR